MKEKSVSKPKFKEYVVICGRRGDVEDNWERRVQALSKAEAKRLVLAKETPDVVCRDAWIFDDGGQRKPAKKRFRPSSAYAVMTSVGSSEKDISTFIELIGTRKDADEFIEAGHPLGQKPDVNCINRRVLYRMTPVPGQTKVRRNNRRQTR